MFNNSTVIYKRAKPLVSSQSIQSIQKKDAAYSTSFVAMCLWLVVGLVNSAKTDISPHATGISISINAADTIVMLITNILLLRGLEKSNQYFVLPWLFTSVWSMYNCHFKSIKKMIVVLKVTRVQTSLPWCAIFVDCLSLALRLLLTFRVAQLMINQWYEKRLKKEIETT